MRLVEALDADFAELAGRLLIFSAWRLALFSQLAESADPVLAAIAAKGVKELTYHRDYAAQWVIRLGDGTPLSHAKMQAALGAVWPLVEELFEADPVTAALPGVAADPAGVRGEVGAVLDAVLAAATLDRPGRPRRWRGWPASPGATACTPRRSGTCSPSCRAWPAPTRARRGNRGGHWPPRARSPRRCPIPNCPW